MKFTLLSESHTNLTMSKLNEIFKKNAKKNVCMQDTPAGQIVDLEGNERTDTEGILRDLSLGKAALCPLGGSGDKMGGYKVRLFHECLI